MNFGLFAMSERYPWENWSLGLDLDIEELQRVEELGFDEYWTGEHHAIPFEGTADPLLMLAKGTAVTDRIKLAPGVVPAPFHDPFKTAERLAQLDHMSHGRMIYGIGNGTLPDLQLFGEDPETKRQKMEEFIDIVATYHREDGPVAYAIEHAGTRVGTVRLFPDRLSVRLDAAGDAAPVQSLPTRRTEAGLVLSVESGAAVKPAVDAIRATL